MEATELEKTKIELEQQRLKIEKTRAEQENRYLQRHLGVIITAAVSLAAVLVSATQIWVASITKEKELEINIQI